MRLMCAFLVLPEKQEIQNQQGERVHVALQVASKTTNPYVAT